MTRIVWMSRHTPTHRQRTTLEAIYPQHHLIIDNRAFDSADDIIARWRMASADEMVLVAPMTVIREIVKRGLHPLHAEMQQIPCSHPESEVRVKGRCYRFVGFRRIKAVNFELEPLSQTTQMTKTKGDAK